MGLSRVVSVVVMVLCLISSLKAAPGHYIHEYYRNQEESHYYGGDRSARSAIHSGVPASHQHSSLALLATIGYLALW